MYLEGTETRALIARLHEHSQRAEPCRPGSGQRSESAPRLQRARTVNGRDFNARYNKDCNTAARVFFALALEQSKEEVCRRRRRRRTNVRDRVSSFICSASLSYTSRFLEQPSICTWTFSSPHKLIRQNFVLWPHHLDCCNEHARPPYSSTSVYTTQAVDRPARHSMARPAFTRRFQSEPARLQVLV